MGSPPQPYTNGSSSMNSRADVRGVGGTHTGSPHFNQGFPIGNRGVSTDPFWLTEKFLSVFVWGKGGGAGSSKSGNMKSTPSISVLVVIDAHMMFLTHLPFLEGVATPDPRDP